MITISSIVHCLFFLKVERLNWAFLIKICPLSVVVIVVVVHFSHFRLPFQNHWTNFNQIWHKTFLDIYWNERQRPFPMGDNNKIARIHWRNIISSKASLSKGDLFLYATFPRGDNNEIVKIHWQNLKLVFSRTTGPISTKLLFKRCFFNTIY